MVFLFMIATASDIGYHLFMQLSSGARMQSCPYHVIKDKEALSILFDRHFLGVRISEKSIDWVYNPPANRTGIFSSS